MYRRNRILRHSLLAVVAASLTLGGAVSWAQSERGERAESQRRPMLEGPRTERGDRPGPGPRSFDGERRPGPQGPHQLLQGLNLTEEQRGQVRTILEEGRENLEKWREQNAEQVETLRAQAQAARQERDREKAQATMTALRELMASAPRPIDVMTKLRAVLNEEQQATFDKRVEAHRERMQAGERPQRSGPAAQGEGRPRRGGPDAQGPDRPRRGGEGRPEREQRRERNRGDQLDI